MKYVVSVVVKLREIWTLHSPSSWVSTRRLSADLTRPGRWVCVSMWICPQFKKDKTPHHIPLSLSPFSQLSQKCPGKFKKLFSELELITVRLNRCADTCTHFERNAPLLMFFNVSNCVYRIPLWTTKPIGKPSRKWNLPRFLSCLFSWKVTRASACFNYSICRILR